MPLKYLIDENLRGDLLGALLEAGTEAGITLDATQVGDKGAPPLETPDDMLLVWCDEEERILVSRDFGTLASYLAAHVAAGTTCPGIFLVRLHVAWHAVLDDLVCLAEASLQDEWRDQILYIPL